ncbi:CARDB domain-containing protein [Longilinea arvoryzae]|uniref:CARDB domain-containing protein n=1 Tax=Longilinea arvoryzae TaxID=360412 RepID=A0A0S7BA86_9CHLR|nr:NBR1-Ig-like domain-containing protein [Longilinea arvoryzae]GAP14391.1 CARDB domain-containing protein [Longilinea arvoryzae]
MLGMKKSAGFIVLVAAALVLAACAPAATPTPDPAEIRTQVAGTVQAGLTQTAAAAPTSTPTNTPEPTFTPTVSTPTSSVTNTPAATITATHAAAPDMAEVVGVTASATYTPGQEFKVTWTVKNTGTNTWASNYQVRCFTTAYCFNGSSTAFGREVKPGEQIDLTITLKAPSTTGDHTTLWVLTNASGVNFGRGMSYSFKVSSSSAATAAPTKTATVTATP